VISLDEEIRALKRLRLEELRSEWRRRYGGPPALQSADLLRRMLAWRIQAAIHGDLDTETRRLIRQASTHPRTRLAPGTRIAREWKGVRHEVVVTAKGYDYGERTYRSLSEVARTITGARWNGLRFFGLRQSK